MAGEVMAETSATTLPQLWDIAAVRRPDAAAVREPSLRLSYGELADHAARYAAWLAGRGVRPGDRVVTRVPNSARMTALVAGILRAGAVAVPTSHAMSRFQFTALTADAEPRLVVACDHEIPSLAAAVTGPVVSIEDSWEQARSTAPGAPTPSDPDDLCLLMYTSGSTSVPKGVMSTHRQVLFAVRAITARLRYRPEDAVFCRVPLSFDYGLYQAFLCAAGGSELLVPPMDADPALLRWIRQWRATVVPVVPSLAVMLSNLARRDPRPTDVRLFTNTGAALEVPDAAALRNAFPGAAISQMFGITECKRVSIMEPDGDTDRPGSVGRPLDGTSVTVVGSDGQPLPPRAVGEFVVHGPHVMAGYWRAPDLTARRFRTDPVSGGRALFTGDFGWADEDGYLYFVGRRDDIFKNKGVRVSTTEIEAAALDIAGVTAAAALPPHDGTSSVLFAVASLPPEEILAELRLRLEGAKLPDRCRVVAMLPVTANGKTDKAALAAMARTPEPAPPATAGTAS